MVSTVVTMKARMAGKMRGGYTDKGYVNTHKNVMDSAGDKVRERNGWDRGQWHGKEEQEEEQEEEEGT